MSNLQTRRLLSLLLIASLSLGLFLLVTGPVQAAQTATGTPGASDTGVASGTAAAGGTPSVTDTPVPVTTGLPLGTPGTVDTTTVTATPETQNGVWSAPVNLSQS